MLNNKENLKSRLHAMLITVSDLRQDQKAQKIGLATDLTPEETERLIRFYSQKAQDLRAALGA